MREYMLRYVFTIILISHDPTSAGSKFSFQSANSASSDSGLSSARCRLVDTTTGVWRLLQIPIQIALSGVPLRHAKCFEGCP